MISCAKTNFHKMIKIDSFKKIPKFQNQPCFQEFDFNTEIMNYEQILCVF